MKNGYLIVTLVVPGLLLAACSAPQTSVSVQTTSQQTSQDSSVKDQTAAISIVATQQSEEVASGQTQQTAVVPKEVDNVKLVATDYRKWVLSSEIIESNIHDWQSWGKQDCYGLMNGNNDGGDLLSTLIADNGTRSELKLKVYTSDYVMGLEKKIVNFTHANDKSDFYANSVCHLGNGVDVATGTLWPQGVAPITQAYSEAHYKTEDINYNQGKNALIIVNNDDVHVYKDIQTYDSTATGAEVYVCGGELKDKNVLWSCFQGLHSTLDDTATDGANMAEWTIPLDGGKVTMRKYVDKE